MNTPGIANSPYSVQLRWIGRSNFGYSQLAKRQFMLSKDLEATLNYAFKGARQKRHEFMTVEHLLLALLDNEVASSVLLAWDVCVAS